MGEFHFRIPEFWDFESRHVRTVHVIGIDGIPRPCNVKKIDNELIIRRNQNESGRTYIAFPFSHVGELTVCTGTLLESNIPYDLALELARGTLNRARNQISIWEEGGLEIPSEVSELILKSIQYFSTALISDDQTKDHLSRQSLDTTMEAIFKLCEEFGREISSYRVNEPEIPLFWLARTSWKENKSRNFDSFDLVAFEKFDDSFPQNADSFNKVVVGPLLDASPGSIFSEGHADFESARQAVLDNCDRLFDTCDQNNVTMIHAASNLNGIGHRNLSYRQQLQLTTELLGKLDQTTSEIPVMISFDYPWAEKLAWSVGGIHPLQIADDLMRTGSKISFIGLDINLDYWPCGSVSRDPLQWIDLIDSWSQIGLPLVICLRVPHEPSEPAKNVEELKFDPAENVTIALDQRTTENETTSPTNQQIAQNSIRENLSDQQRYNLLEVILPMVVARPSVHGIIWRQWSDQQEPRFPFAGLIDDLGKEKSTLRAIQNLRDNTLKR
ncbi:MAG: hypothetical protein AAGA30_05975 [Planctomycetota bacterium]